MKAQKNIMDLECEKRTFARSAFYIGTTHPFDMNEVTKILNIEPNYLWQQSKDWLIGLPNCPQATWGYELPETEHDSSDKPINAILDVFWPYRDIIIPFVKEHNLSTTIDILIRMHESELYCNMDFMLEPETMKRICELNASLQVSHYVHDKV